jgi:putative PIN family toxin of toxin-antitoxin system
MKVFFDTNVLVAAYATHGACNELLNHCIAHHAMYTSDFVLGELADKLHHRIKLTADETALIIHFLRRRCVIAAETPITHHISRDHDDDHVLSAACYGRVNCIITGDNDLLVLKKIGDILIVKPADFWKIELREDILR